LCFKEIEPEFREDPGEQLRKVLDFQKKQETLKQVFFRKFSDPNGWSGDLTSWITE
jgi:hypothetical protein